MKTKRVLSAMVNIWIDISICKYYRFFNSDRQSLPRLGLDI